jgi:hypothetical protein
VTMILLLHFGTKFNAIKRKTFCSESLSKFSVLTKHFTELRRTYRTHVEWIQ